MQRSLIHESSRHKHGSGSKPLYTHNPSHFLWKPVRYIHHLNEQVRMLPFMKDQMFPLSTALHPCLRASRIEQETLKGYTKLVLLPSHRTSECFTHPAAAATPPSAPIRHSATHKEWHHLARLQRLTPPPIFLLRLCLMAQ